MSAAIQLINQPAVETGHDEPMADNQYNNVSLFETAPEQRMRRAAAYIAQLQAEIRTLREELTRAERAVTHHEQLLRNSTVREQELRSQLAEQMQR